MIPFHSDRRDSRALAVRTHVRTHAYASVRVRGERAVVFQRAVDLVSHMHTYRQGVW